MVQVSGFVDPRMLVEVEVVAFRHGAGASRRDGRRPGDPVPRRRRGPRREGRPLLELRDAGDPVEMARLYDAEGADELTFLDVTASSAGARRRTTSCAARQSRCSSRSPWAAACAP
jgi:hypothetical protein